MCLVCLPFWQDVRGMRVPILILEIVWCGIDVAVVWGGVSRVVLVWA